MVNRWDYKGQPSKPYGDDVTYRLGAEWLKGLAVEDWGCGLGWFRKFHTDPYLGIDGSRSEFADVVCGLDMRQGFTEGLFMRHVLEHNRNWRVILRNAIRSFTRRMCLVLFTPLDTTDRVLTIEAISIPDISLCKADLRVMLGPHLVREETVRTGTRYNFETVFYLSKE